MPARRRTMPRQDRPRVVPCSRPSPTLPASRERAEAPPVRGYASRGEARRAENWRPGVAATVVPRRYLPYRPFAIERCSAAEHRPSFPTASRWRTSPGETPGKRHMIVRPTSPRAFHRPPSPEIRIFDPTTPIPATVGIPVLTNDIPSTIATALRKLATPHRSALALLPSFRRPNAPFCDISNTSLSGQTLHDRIHKSLISNRTQLRSDPDRPPLQRGLRPKVRS